MRKILQFIPSNELYFFGLMLFAASLPLSKFTMSVAQFVIAGNWLLEGNYKQKFSLLKHNKIAWIIMSLYFIHLIGLWNTSDFNYATNDLRTKIPLLIFPFLMATSKPLNRKQTDIILFLVFTATIISSFISLFIYLGITDKQITDIRQISPLISHIRLALLVCVSVAIACYFYIYPQRASFVNLNVSSTKVYAFISTLWMIIFLVILESLTGLFILTLGCISFSAYKIINPATSIMTKFKIGAAILIIIATGYFAASALLKPFKFKEQVNYNRLPQKTVNGNPYTHFIHEKFTENGHYYGLFHCEKELRKAWNERSNLSYDSADLKQQALNFTLMRYLTSRGLTKDSFGVSQLSNNDIHLIEQGIANHKIPKMNPLESRAYQVYCEYQSYKEGYNASGHSVTMRFHYWQAAILIIKNNFFAGVGTGDLEKAFQDKYIEIKSPLEPTWRHRAHNQYLTMFVAFGVFGFLFFVAWLILPMLIKKEKPHPVYFAFIFIFLISMLFEDTLETQAGLSFAIFFTCLFMLESNKQSIESNHSNRIINTKELTSRKE